MSFKYQNLVSYCSHTNTWSMSVNVQVRYLPPTDKPLSREEAGQLFEHNIVPAVEMLPVLYDKGAFVLGDSPGGVIMLENPEIPEADDNDADHEEPWN